MSLEPIRTDLMLACIRRKIRVVGGVMLASLTLTSCYSTIPVRATPSPGAELILDMTDEATERLGGFLGRGTVSARGSLLAWEPDSIVLSMRATGIAGGDEQLWRGERVAIPREAIARISQRRVNRGRTAALVLAGVAVLVTAFELTFGTEGGSSGGGTKPVPQ